MDRRDVRKENNTPKKRINQNYKRNKSEGNQGTIRNNKLIVNAQAYTVEETKLINKMDQLEQHPKIPQTN